MINKYNIGQDIIIESTTSPYGIRAGKVVAFTKNEYTHEDESKNSSEIRYDIKVYPLYQNGEQFDDGTLFVNNVGESFIYEKFDDAFDIIKKHFMDSHSLPFMDSQSLPNNNIFE